MAGSRNQAIFINNISSVIIQKFKIIAKTQGCNIGYNNLKSCLKVRQGGQKKTSKPYLGTKGEIWMGPKTRLSSPIEQKIKRYMRKNEIN